MKKNIFIVGLGVFFITAFAGTIAADEPMPAFHIMTEHWIPYQFLKDDTLQGISVDLLVDLLKRVGSNQGRADIEIVPWARGYRFAQKEENAILFLTSRTPQRESLFKWVGPVIQNHWELIAKKSRHLKFDSQDDLLNYTYGTVIDDVGEQFLVDLGIQKERLERTSAYANSIKMLKAGRVDMVAMSWETFSLFAGREDIDTFDYESVFTLASSDLYYAFHKNAPQWIVAKFQEALNALKAEGKLDALKEKYADLKN